MGSFVKVVTPICQFVDIFFQVTMNETPHDRTNHSTERSRF
jgi:hypothetical protein